MTKHTHRVGLCNLGCCQENPGDRQSWTWALTIERVWKRGNDSVWEMRRCQKLMAIGLRIFKRLANWTKWFGLYNADTTKSLYLICCLLCQNSNEGWKIFSLGLLVGGSRGTPMKIVLWALEIIIIIQFLLKL